MTAPQPGCARCGGGGWVWLMADTGGPRNGAEASCPDCCAPSPRAVLDWREAHRWALQAAACRYCGRLTHLRDDDTRPAHKVCATTAAAALEVTAIGSGS